MVLIFLLVINCCFVISRFSLLLLMTPLLSSITMFSFFAPSERYNLVQAIAEAPAPLTTIFTLSIFLSTNINAFSNAALEIIAVPCWSSCMSGIFICSLSVSSMMKLSGAFISSRLMPPKVGSSAFTILINSSGSSQSTSISKTSMPANFLNKTPFPSITGFEAAGPIFPRPNTAVPLEITPTKFPFAVYL